VTFLATFDVEDWFHAENVKTSLTTDDWDALEPRVERNTHELLDLLAETGARSTFFVLGWIARRYPELVRRIVDEGHELASHSDLHRRLYSLPRDELVRDLADARDSLEQLAGVPVLGLRAPTFSVDDAVLDVVAEAGYRYDSSVFPFGAHDRYGRVAAPDEPVFEIRPGLLELTLPRLGRVPWAGGGYFRLIPYPLYRAGVDRVLGSRGLFTFYLHPWELDHEEPRPAGMPRTLRFRAYVGRRRVRRDLRRLLEEFGSARIDEALGLAPVHSPEGAAAVAASRD
jgi:polysaccharide deacetylase family protein (PEP-CTERM system associated)